MISKLSSYLSKTKRIFKVQMAVVLFMCLLGQITADIILQTTSGSVRGVSSLQEDVEVFLGIPYAEPPIGDLRFAKPLPKQKWQDVYDASIIPPPCSQISFEILKSHYLTPNITNMSEDCLYLNVWVPTSKYVHGLRPIIIFIHGGAFLAGSSNQKPYDGSKMAKQGDLIVVTINYRLGSFGYFLAYVEEANGNMGMYDQVMAINWIKDNAENFGGDPENIVLMGQSAGAFSVSAHLVSPLSQNLFKRAILESGSIIVPSILDENVRLFRNSETLASMVGCANKTTNLKNDPNEVVRCLKRKPAGELVAVEKTQFKSNPMVFYPRMNDEFMPKSSLFLFREGKFRKDVDVLLGVDRDEGTLFLTLSMPDYFGVYGKNNVQSIKKSVAVFILKELLKIFGQENASEIINFYINLVQNHTSLEYTKIISDLLGDYIVACGTVFNADLLSLKGNRVYFYNFEFRAASTPMAEWVGVTHVDEVQYVFGNPFHENFTAEEIELSTRLMDRWAAFARHGNPNIPGHIPWLRYSYHKPLYLNIGQKEETIRMKPVDRCEIWRKRFKADIDVPLIRFLRNSGMNLST